MPAGGYNPGMGTLYVVGTPIGNLEDLTLRASRILGEVDLISAEDTRVTRKLLNHLGLRTPMISCHQNNWRERLPALLRALEAGDAAMVTDAGMPAVSDPGSNVVSEIAAKGFAVEVVPGVSAVTAGLSVSGMTGDAFLFLGFLPRRGKERGECLQRAAAAVETVVLFESPHRLEATIADLKEAMGNRRVAVGRELTKLHEEVFRGTLEEAGEHFSAPRGEFVLVVEGAGNAPPETGEAGLEAAFRELSNLRESGAKAKDAVPVVAESHGLPKRRVYQLWLETGWA